MSAVAGPPISCDWRAAGQRFTSKVWLILPEGFVPSRSAAALGTDQAQCQTADPSGISSMSGFGGRERRIGSHHPGQMANLPDAPAVTLLIRRPGHFPRAAGEQVTVWEGSGVPGGPAPAQRDPARWCSMRSGRPGKGGTPETGCCQRHRPAGQDSNVDGGLARCGAYDGLALRRARGIACLVPCASRVRWVAQCVWSAPDLRVVLTPSSTGAGGPRRWPPPLGGRWLEPDLPIALLAPAEGIG